MARVSVTIEDHIARVTLTRANKKNAMDDLMIDEIIGAGRKIAQSAARAVILTGEGDSFCAGIDISGLSKMIGQDIESLLLPRTHGDGTTNRWQEVAMVWQRLDIPVLAVLQGAVFGAGLQLALGADIRFATPNARLSVMEMKWGLVPDMGGMVLLPKLVREDVLKMLVFTAAPINAAQAAQWGLVTQVVEDPLQEAIRLAEELTQKGPNALRAAKTLCARAYVLGADQMLLEESCVQATLLGKAEQMEVIAAQFGKRKPDFDKLAE